MRLCIREAAPDDALAMLSYVEQISRETDFLSFGPGEFGMDENQERSFLKSCMESANQLFLIGLVDDRIVSSVMFMGNPRKREQHTGLLGLAVLKEFWSNGIASAMMAELISWAGQSPIVTKLQLKVRTDNDRAIKLYERDGFSIEGTITRDFCVDGRYFDHHLMSRDV